MDNPEAYLDRLKPIHLFKGLSDDELLEVLKAFTLERHSAGTLIFQEGEPGDCFYLLTQGQVKVHRRERDGALQPVAVLVPGDFFGEGAVLYGRRRSATMEAAANVEVLALDKAAFERLVQRHPALKANVLLTAESMNLLRRNPLKWLDKGEVVYLIVRKHQLRLWQALVAPVILGLLIALGAIWAAVITEQLWIAWLGAVLEAAVAAWIVWLYVDWGNDFYIVTNQRLVHVEKVVALFDSRVEAPLRSITSVDKRTDDFIQRTFGIGDVVVSTLAGPIELKSVGKPAELEDAIKEYWHRTHASNRQSELDHMAELLRDRLEHGPAPVRPPGARPPPRPPPPPLPLTRRIANFLTLSVRFEEGGAIVYRRHWFILARRIWRQTLAFIAVAVVLAVVAAGVLPFEVPWLALLLAGMAALIPLSLWWLYDYVDWLNDVYKVTNDQILAITKKPLGAETKKSARLENVQSLKYDRPGLLAIVLDYGTVVAQVVGAEFRFEGVFDPVSVQNDISRRIEAFKNKQRADEEAKKRTELADMLAVYHQVEEERRHKAAAP
jgi:hypothetical protein